MKNAMKRVRMVDLDQPLGEVELVSGRVLPIRPITIKQAELFDAIKAGQATDADVLVLARLLLPEATAEELEVLTPGAIAALAMMASGHVDAVLAIAGQQAEGQAENPPVPGAEAGTSSAPGAGSPTSSPSSDAPAA